MPRIEAISKSSARQRGGCATVFLVGFLGLFVAAGCGIGYFLSARPLYRAWQASSWTPTACEVISSRVVHGDDTSRADIVYRYHVGGREYTANRYNFIPGSTSDSTVPAVVAKHAPGTKFECYVDPADPSRAVINRTPTLWYFFGLLFFVMFAGIPSAIGLAVVYGKRRDRVATQAAISAQARSVGAGSVGSVGSLASVGSFGAVDSGSDRFATAFATGDTGPIVLKPSSSPMGKLIGVTFACLFWNGIVGIFTFLEYRMFTTGDSAFWFLGLFLLIFQAIGVALLVAVPYQMLALANPRPIITLSRETVPLGGSVSFAWELSGAAQRVSALKFTLHGKEEARYRRGTDTHTDTHVFLTETLVDATHAMNIARGNGTIRIPADSMHTFTADNNKIVWTLQVTGEIPRWPNVDESFDIVVRPA
jgi:Protein of unknown function (DUF3592)